MSDLVYFECHQRAMLASYSGFVIDIIDVLILEHRWRSRVGDLGAVASPLFITNVL